MFCTQFSSFYNVSMSHICARALWYCYAGYIPWTILFGNFAIICIYYYWLHSKLHVDYRLQHLCWHASMVLRFASSASFGWRCPCSSFRILCDFCVIRMYDRCYGTVRYSHLDRGIRYYVSHCRFHHLLSFPYDFCSNGTGRWACLCSASVTLIFPLCAIMCIVWFDYTVLLKFSLWNSSLLNCYYLLLQYDSAGLLPHLVRHRMTAYFCVHLYLCRDYLSS